MTQREHERLLREHRVRRRKRARRCRIVKLILKKTVLFLSFVLLLLVIVIKSVGMKTDDREKNRKTEAVETEMIWTDEEDIDLDNNEMLSHYDEELIINLKNLDDNSKVDSILAQIDQYPEDLLELLVNNPETLDFVANYPKQKNSSEISESISISDCDKTNGIPLFLQWDSRWGYCNYGDKMIALTGCGPTCLSMVAVGLTGEFSLNPGIVSRYSEESGYLDKNNGTSWSLMTLGAEKLGLSSREIPLDETIIAREVLSGHPVICSMRPGDFTTEGHFIVLCGYENGNFTINDPNSRLNSDKVWSFSTLQYQIKNLWAFSIR